MKILPKLLTGFIAVAVITAIVGIVGITRVSDLSLRLGEVRDNTIPSINSVMDLEIQHFKIKEAIRSLAISRGSDDATYIKRQMDIITQAREDYNKDIQTYDALPRTREEDALWKTTQAKMATAKAYNNEIIDLADKAIQSGPGMARDAYFDQIFTLINGPRRAEFDDAVTSIQQLISFIDQHYGVDQVKVAAEVASQGEIILLIVTILAFIVAVLLGIFLGRTIADPLKKTVSMLDKLAAGDLGDRLLIKSKDEFSQVAASLNQVADSLSKLIDEMNHMSAEHDAGDIDVKVDGDKFQGAYRKMAEGVNTMVFGHIAVKKKAMACFDEFGRGNFEAPIEKFPGKKAFINETVERVRANLKALIADADLLVQAAIQGKLATRADASKHQGDFRKIVQGVNDTLDAVIGPLNVTAEYVDKVSKGVIPPEITTEYMGQYNVIKQNLNNMVRMMNELLAETDKITRAAADGALDTRADASKFVGGWNQLVAGVNATITNIVNPLNVTADYVDKVSKGIIPPEITTEYKGQYNVIKQNLNNMVRMMAELLAETDKIIKAAADGALDTRADASRFVGGWNKLVAGVNDTITNIVNPLMVTADNLDKISAGDIPPKITTEYKGQYNLIKNNLNRAIDAVNNLVGDAGMLAQAAVEGRLQTRADATRHQGDYRKIVEGVNRTLDLVITPINETNSILKHLAEGDLTQRIASDYKGDFDVLKTSLNTSLNSINDTLSQINDAVDQVAEGAQQVSQASQSLSQGATEQASSLEEITSSITEISSQTKTNTDNAVTVNGLARTAKENAERGNEQMKDLVSAMSDINTSAEEIKKVTKAIDDISFQINLLALNANVEAARAGKYGKGFAVVAEEVRNLAVRSANSVKETARMVEEAIANIERGNNLVGVTAKQLSEIVEGAAQVATLAEEVAKAGKEQAIGLEQVSQGLSQIDQVTQANTATAEESASASEELSSQSQQVKSMLSRFRLKARESRMSDADVIRMMKAEMARQQHSGAATSLAAPTAKTAKPGNPAAVPGRNPVRKINPADVISLDDDDFGKF